MLLASISLLLLPVAPQEPVAPPSEPPTAEAPEGPRPPGARHDVEGLAGFRSESTLEFVGRPELPRYSLESTYVFPERVRWQMAPVLEDDQRPAKSLRYQFGLGIWELPAREPHSVAHTGGEALRYRLQNELRRIAMTWPAGLSWELCEDGRQRAEVEGLGTFEAELSEPGPRPTSLQSFLPGEDVPFEALVEMAWRQAPGGERWWPRSWTLTSRGAPIWDETIDQVHTGQRFLEGFFLPADQRLASAHLESPSAVQLAARVTRRFPLPEGLAWREALTRGDSAIARAREELGEALRVNPRPAFLLDAQGHPTAFELQLVGEVEELPEGWQRSPAMSGWSLLLTDLDPLSSRLLEALAGQLEPGQAPGTPFVRVQFERERVGLVQLILPFREAR